MDNDVLDLKRRACQLTGDFSTVMTSAMVALNTPPLTEETLAMVRECGGVGQVYGGALEELLTALRAEADAPEGIPHTERFRELLGREVSILGALRAQEP